MRFRLTRIRASSYKVTKDKKSCDRKRNLSIAIICEEEQEWDIYISSGSRHERYKIDRPTADRTVALVAKVPKSGRSCNTLRDSLKAAREGKKEKK